MRSRSLPSFLVTAALGASCGGGAASPEDGPRPPDVVLILLDTLRADALSAYGNEHETAPYLARLAAGGTVFETAYSVSTWTAPSTASLLTGVYPDRHGVTRGFVAQFREGEPVHEDRLPDLELLAIARETPTLAERFRELGYRTFGLASNVNVGPEMEFERGFDRFERHDLRPAKELRQHLLEWQDEIRSTDDPCFVYLHFNDVHQPYDLRPRWYRPGENRKRGKEDRARYESELGYLDFFLARIHEDLGVDEDTLLVVASDHGEEFFDHGGFFHDFTLYVELSWIPLVVHAPGLRVAPGRARGNVSLIDVAPTIFDLCGLPVPGDLDGRSLAPLCWAADKGAPVDRLVAELDERPLFLHRLEDDVHLWGVIHGDWKLIRAPEGDLLFDRATDPREQTNLAPERPEVVERLAALLASHVGRGSNPSSTRTNVEIDEDLLRRLREAGYVGGDDEDDGGD